MTDTAPQGVSDADIEFFRDLARTKLAPPERPKAAGVRLSGLVMGALAGLAWALRRLGGPWLAGAGLVAAGLALWGLGGDVPASVWNPFIVALPFAAFLALAVATVATRRAGLPGSSS